jgi:hypothetical protein
MEDVLIDDMIVVIMKHLDPLSLVLFGMTSKVNRERRQRPGSGRVWSALTPRMWRVIEITYSRNTKPVKWVEKKIFISVLLEFYASPEVFSWAGPIWPESRSGRDSLALVAHNFTLAHFLVSDQNVPLSSFFDYFAVKEPDFEILEFIIAHRPVSVLRYHYSTSARTPALLKWIRDRDPLHGVDMEEEISWGSRRLNEIADKNFQERFFRPLGAT